MALLDTDVEDDEVDQLMNLTTNLLRIALNDPGFPNPRKVCNVTCSTAEATVIYLSNIFFEETLVILMQ